jgi:molecular chaperone GrpE
VRSIFFVFEQVFKHSRRQESEQSEKIKQSKTSKMKEDIVSEMEEAVAAENPQLQAELLDNLPEVAETPEAEIERLKQESEGLKDALTRQVADFQNYRRRTEQEITRTMQFGKESAIMQVLEVFDDLERSVQAAQQSDSQDAAFVQLKTGVELVHQKFAQQLAKLSVTAIETAGQPFDEKFHEALMQQPATEEIPSGNILQELQKGYKMGDRVLRHSKVIVAV